MELYTKDLLLRTVDASDLESCAYNKEYPLNDC